jgi:hypothetical protein
MSPSQFVHHFQISNAVNNQVYIQDSGLKGYNAVILKVVLGVSKPLEHQHSTVTHKTSILWSTATTMYLASSHSTNTEITRTWHGSEESLLST